MKKLNILWTTGEEDVALRMIFVYILNAKANGWWDSINLIIWGASAKLVGESPLIRKEIDLLLQSGVTIEACRACTDSYNVTGLLEEMGVSIHYMGEPFTGYLNSGDKLLTF
jgi:hypothetical protein